MKRKKILAVGTALLLAIFVLLNISIIDPEDYSGVWYRAGNQVCYVFEEGIISEYLLEGESVFCGAYVFAKDKISVFVIDETGVGELVELRLVRKGTGDVLCEYRDSQEIIWFGRNIDSLVVE